MKPVIAFHGAAGTVTGSCYRIDHDGTSFLVDCGMYQGNRSVKELNFRPFPFDPAKIDFLVLTHAHIDHCGLVPKLVKHGFSGPIYATAPTIDLLEFLLLDSAGIQEYDAERLNRRHRREGKPEVKPAYTKDDARAALKLCQPVAYEEPVKLAGRISLRFWNAGHILGSASADLRLDDPDGGHPIRILCSGDLGPDEKAFYAEPDAPTGYDYILCESTYGGRDRDDYTLAERRAALKREINTALDKGGNLIIPAFAVERSQELLHDIGVLMHNREIPKAKLFLDSPLARKVTEVFIRYAGTMEDVELDEAKLFRNPSFTVTETADDSRAINRVKGGAIIISASGMCDAGRIKHHLRNNLWRKNATVLFVGYQAPGSLGRVIQGGAKEVRIHGRTVKVNAAIRRIGNYSAHADQGELVDWIRERLPAVGAIFLIHGEQDAREALKAKLVETGLPADKIVLPALDEVFDLVAGSPESKGRAATRIDDAEIERDWQADYAELSIALARAVESAPDPATRAALLARVRGALGG